MPAKRIWLSIILLLSLALLLGSEAGEWQVYAYRKGSFVPLEAASRPFDLTSPPTCPVLALPPAWDVRRALPSDFTGAPGAECTLLVWRPWADWPIMRWAEGESPIAGNRDAAGDSAHVIVITPEEAGAYRERWAGSALALPVLDLRVGDVTGNSESELVVLESDYAKGRAGPARHVAVWTWNGFGFTLLWRSPPGRFMTLDLADVTDDGTLELLVR